MSLGWGRAYIFTRKATRLSVEYRMPFSTFGFGYILKGGLHEAGGAPMFDGRICMQAFPKYFLVVWFSGCALWTVAACIAAVVGIIYLEVTLVARSPENIDALALLRPFMMLVFPIAGFGIGVLGFVFLRVMQLFGTGARRQLQAVLALGANGQEFPD